MNKSILGLVHTDSFLHIKMGELLYSIIKCHALGKGQLISKCPFGVIVWTKIPTKNLTNFCPRI